MKENIVGITLGIRYSKSFRIPDIAGEIADRILYSPDSPFDADFFPQLQENSNREKTLHNPTTKDYLRINTDDIILGISLDNNFESKFNFLKDEVVPFFKDKLFKEFGIKNIKRFGIVYDHIIPNYNQIGEAIKTLTKNNESSTENVNISFSKKYASEEALYRSGVNDYRNIIYTFSEAAESVLVRLDFQYYYDPLIEDLRECFDEKILNDSLVFLEKKFHSWLREEME